MKSPIIFLLIFLFEIESVEVEGIIETCLIKILKKYFLNQPVLLISDLTIDRLPFRASLFPNLKREHNGQIIGKIMEKIKWTLQIYNTRKYVGLPPRLKLGRLKNCFFFIQPGVMASDILFEWEMDRLRKNPLWNPTGRTLVVVKADKDVNGTEDLARRVIEKMWTESKAVDNLVMVVEESGVVGFYTWFPYKQPDCSKVREVVKLDTFNRGRFLWKAHLFPEKIEDGLGNCELVAAVEECVPYVFADENNPNKFVDGLEIQIINTLSDILKFRLITVRPRNMWTTSVNKSLTGAFKLLVEQKVDLAFSCLMLNRERYLLALPLPSYYEDSLVWFVPSPTLTSHATDIFNVFPENFWLLMVSVMTAAIVLINALSYIELESHDWEATVVVSYVIRLIGLSLYAPIEIPAKKTSFRLFIFVFFLYSMHITIAFQSSLFSLYRRPHYNGLYSSLKQAVDDGLFVYLRSSTPVLYNQTNHALWNKILRPGHFDYLKDFEKVFSEIAYDKTAVALYIKTTGIYMTSVYFTDKSGTPQILWLREKFAPYPVTMYLSPGNPLFSVFEERVHRLLASGLITRWLSRAILGEELEWSEWSREGFTNNSLSMKHMGGVFFLLLLLLCTSSLAFVAEMIIFRFFNEVKKKKKPNHRHFLPPKSKNFNSNSVSILRVVHESETFLP